MGGVDNTRRVEHSGPTHIPLSWPRRHEGKFYASSDPEWQEFIKISRDRQKIQSLKGRYIVYSFHINFSLYLHIGDELATIVLNDASRSNLLAHVLGQPLNITGFWLLHHFPSRAPPEYDRLGYVYTYNLDNNSNLSDSQ